MIKSYAKATVVVPYSKVCRICAQLETNPASLWKVARDTREACQKLIIDVEEQQQQFMTRYYDSASQDWRGIDSSSRRDLDDKSKDLQLKLEKARLEFDLKDIILESISKLDINQDIVKNANQTFRTFLTHTLSIDSDRFFMGDKISGEEETISSFPQGGFDHKVIQDYHCRVKSFI